MTENEILEGLKMAKKKNPNATIGNAVEQMMGLDLFWHDKYLSDITTVSANIPQECIYTVDAIAGVIGCINNMVREHKIRLLGMDMTYGKPTEHNLKRLNTPGAISPIYGSTNNTWQLLSSQYEFTNI